VKLRSIPRDSEGFSPEMRRSSPTKVLTAPLSLKACVVLGLPISMYAHFWLFAYFRYPTTYSTWRATAVFCGIFLTLLSFSFCWSAILAYFIRRSNLSPKTCLSAGVPFLLVGLAIFAIHFVTGRPDTEMPTIVFVALLTPALCRKLAYPTINNSQLHGLEPRPPGVF
jgi:hypothetical protein